MLRKIMPVILACLLIVLPVMAIGEADNTPSPDENEAETTDTAVRTDYPTLVGDDEGGPLVITGELTYTYPLFTNGVSQPLIILEDQGGFVNRDRDFIFPLESQVLGQITSDFFTSPFSYSVTLPREPQATLHDVDNDGETDRGVMIYSIAYWTNMFGDPYLEKRDMQGGGWSSGYASIEVDLDPENYREVIGGKYLIYAPDDEQDFPAGFGDDGKLFTDDDPIMAVPQGYSVIDLNVEPFTINRQREQRIDLIEPDLIALTDFSDLSYVDAFNAMVDKFAREYAYTDYYGLDWEALRAEYEPQFRAAQQAGNPEQYALAMRDFLWEIPDGHIGMSLNLISQRFLDETAGGVGFAIRELDDGRVITTFILPGAPAAEAGIEVGAEIVEMDGRPIADVISETFVWAHEALGTPHTERLQQLRYVTRRPLGETMELTYRNPGETETTTVTLRTIQERQSFVVSSFNAGITGNELPVEFEILPSGYGYVSIYSFSDDEYLTVQLWERMIRTFKAEEVPGIIIDMRNNGGGSGYLADQLSAYFFDSEEPILAGQTAIYNEALGDFFFEEGSEDKLFPPPEDLRYTGPLAIIVAPPCFSACEFFSYNLTLQDRAMIVGHYPTGGLGGSVNDFNMPEGISVRYTRGRAVDMDGNIHIEGKGVAPTVRVPVTEETLFAEDALLDAAENAVIESIRGEIVDAGSISFGTEGTGTRTATGIVQPGQSVEYEVELRGGTIVSFYSGDQDNALDTVLRIYSQDGEMLFENDDAESGGPGSALEGLRVGSQNLTVILAVTLADEEPSGTFFLTIEAIPDSDG